MHFEHGTLKDSEIAALALVTTDWKSALELKANEPPLITLSKKGMVQMQVDWVMIDGHNVKIRKFSLKQKETV